MLAWNRGVFHTRSAVTPAQVTDGLSQTIVFAERAHGLIDPTQASSYDWWPVGGPFMTDFISWWGINPQRRFPANTLVAGAALFSVSSFHPGGANVAMLDGSVRFLKDTIDTWPVDPLTGDTGAYWDPSCECGRFRPGTRFGVYQALTTRNWGEVIGADAY
jgi:prepilin-type processing-associated H-X9-DG protein